MSTIFDQDVSQVRDHGDCGSWRTRAQPSHLGLKGSPLGTSDGTSLPPASPTEVHYKV